VSARADFEMEVRRAHDLLDELTGYGRWNTGTQGGPGRLDHPPIAANALVMSFNSASVGDAVAFEVEKRKKTIFP
jgi:hypothetical protein